MTLEQLIDRREELCFLIIEANSNELAELEQELMWVEEQLNEINKLERLYEEEIY